jgi:uncharacterized protein YndB with AHSA1/START domain
VSDKPLSDEPLRTDAVTLERRIAARPETVFSFFTDREKWLSWMGRDGEFSFEPGGAYRTNVSGEHVAEGRFVEIDPPKRLVLTWGWAGDGMSVPPGSTTVEITLEPVADGTLLRLVHRDLPSPESCAAHREGWLHYVDRLATLAAGGDPGPDDWM